MPRERYTDKKLVVTCFHSQSHFLGQAVSSCCDFSKDSDLLCVCECNNLGRFWPQRTTPGFYFAVCGKKTSVVPDGNGSGVGIIVYLTTLLAFNPRRPHAVCITAASFHKIRISCRATPSYKDKAARSQTHHARLFMANLAIGC